MSKSKSKSTKGASNVLRISGLLFAGAGTFHILRYFFGWEFKVASFELTLIGSLLAGVLLSTLSFCCFLESYK